MYFTFYTGLNERQHWQRRPWCTLSGLGNIDHSPIAVALSLSFSASFQRLLTLSGGHR